MKKIVDIILLVLLFIPIALVAILNSLILWLGDATGLHALLYRGRIKRRYLPAARKPGADSAGSRLDRVRAELGRQGYRSEDAACLIENEVVAVRAYDPASVNSKTKNPKAVYYLEGTPFEIGRFLGRLAEPEAGAMSRYFVDNVVFDYVGLENVKGPWGAIIADFVYLLSRWNDSIIPEDMRAEIYGIWAGATEKNPKTLVNIRDLYILNYGIDIILSYVYAGFEPVLRFLGIKVSDFKPPIGCNAFTARPELTAEGHMLFGRNFMFPTCGIFGDVAAHTALVPVSDGSWYEKDGRELPRRLVSLCAPGMVGSVIALNEDGVSMGLNMVAGRRCSWRRVGLNSLLMVRHAVGAARDAATLQRAVARAPRGVTWLHPYADPKAGGVMEVSASARRGKVRNWLRHTPRSLRKLLPDRAFVAAHAVLPDLGGMFARPDDYAFPADYLNFNAALFKNFGKPFPDQEAWGPAGLMNDLPTDSAMPDGYYFAPLRVERPGLMVTGNHYLVPEMRLSAMNEWTSFVPAEGHSFDDFQWRYDRLNLRLRNYLGSDSAPKPLSVDAAWDCINFLRPYDGDKKAEFWFYYGKKKDGSEIPPDQVEVEGSVSLADCTGLTLTSLYGMYVDKAATLDLKALLAVL